MMDFKKDVLSELIFFFAIAQHSILPLFHVGLVSLRTDGNSDPEDGPFINFAFYRDFSMMV